MGCLFPLICLFTAIIVPGIREVAATKLPSFIQPCYRNDPNLSECVFKESRRILKKLTEGIPELGLDSMDPLYVGDIDTATAPGGLKFKQYNAVMTGLKNANIIDMRYDINIKKGSLHAKGDMILKSNYTTTGRLLLFVINAKGECTTKMIDYDLYMNWNFELFDGKDDKQYVRMRNYTTKIDFVKTQVKMTGLFNNDKVLEDTLNNLISTYSKEIIKEIGAPSIRKIEKRLSNIFNHFFKQIPYDELMLPGPKE